MLAEEINLNARNYSHLCDSSLVIWMLFGVVSVALHNHEAGGFRYGTEACKVKANIKHVAEIFWGMRGIDSDGKKINKQ
jgi:hypothetical protein